MLLKAHVFFLFKAVKPPIFLVLSRKIPLFIYFLHEIGKIDFKFSYFVLN